MPRSITRSGWIVLPVLIVVAFAAVVWLPAVFPRSHGINDAARSAEIGRNRTAVLAFFAGLLALVGAVFTGLNFSLSRRGQVAERLFRAVEQLDDEKPAALRLAAVYELEAIVQESPRDRTRVVNVLRDLEEHSPPDARAVVEAGRIVDVLDPDTPASRVRLRVRVGRALQGPFVGIPGGLVLAAIFVGVGRAVGQEVGSLSDVFMAIAAATLGLFALGEVLTGDRRRVPDVPPLIVRRVLVERDLAEALEEFEEGLVAAMFARDAVGLSTTAPGEQPDLRSVDQSLDRLKSAAGKLNDIRNRMVHEDPNEAARSL